MNKRNFSSLLVVLFLFSISNAHAGSECFSQLQKYCSWRVSNPSYTDFSDYCAYSNNEKRFSEDVFKNHDLSLKEWRDIGKEQVYIHDQIGDSVKYMQEKIDKGFNNPMVQFELCYFKEQYSYYLNGAKSKPNSSSTQSSSSGAPSPSNQNTNRQSTGNQSANNQSNQNTSNTPKPDPMGEMGNILGVVAEPKSSNGLNMKPEQAALVNEASRTYASRTAAFEESHKGLKRTHNKDAEASRCLTMDGRHISNTCDYRVEYMFCAYKPNQQSFRSAFEMAAAFDCEKNQMGMQGLGPKRKQGGTFTAEAIYLFGCKDPSYPSGVTYERGRGLSGWCE